jgi:hypothetical protein
MLMAVSEIDIVCGALLHAGLDPIASFDEDSKSARTAKIMYPGARDAMLRMHSWNFAKKRVALAQDTNLPASGFDFQYILPADFVMMGKGDDAHRDWSIERTDNGMRLLTNETSIVISYYALITDPNQWDTIFRECLEHWIASKFASALRNAPQVAAALENEYKELLRLARVQNAHEDPMAEFKDDDLTRARNRGYSSMIPWDMSTP